MANATVESLKRFGLRHGEKVAVGLIAALCVVFMILAGSKKTIDFTPEDIDKATTAANTNINRQHTPKEVLEKLDQDKLIDPEYAKQVAVAETKGRPALAFNGPPLVYTEPGAGLIREMPTLIAPIELYASASRGAIPVIETDDKGDIVYETPPKDEPKKATHKKKRASRFGSGMMSSSSGGGSGSGGSSSGGRMSSGGEMGGLGGNTKKETEAEKKKREETEERRRKQLFVGKASEAEKKVAEDIEAKEKEGLDPKVVTKGYRIVALIGELDHQKLVDNFVKALKDTNAQPHYLRLDVQRRIRGDGQAWGEWSDVNRSTNEDILAHVTETDEEMAPEDVRLEGLVDLLPFYKIGYHRGVHLASLVPEDKVNPQTQTTGGMRGSGGKFGSMSGGMSSSGGLDSSMEGGMSRSSTSGGGSSSGAGDSSRGSGMSSFISGMSSGGGSGSGSGSGSGFGLGMGSGSAGGPPEDTDFAKTSAPKVMIRALDFTVTPDTVYQYRVRIVVKNPNLGWESVKPGTDTTTEEMPGPWSEPSPPVYMPADVTTYAMQTSPGNTVGDSVQFQVVKWNEADGLTIVKTFEETPGSFIGEQASAAVPKEDNKGRTSKSIDFTSGHLLLDASGGSISLATVGLPAASTFSIPAQALVLRSDGLMIVRDQARDAHNLDMKELKAIADDILKDADEGGKKSATERAGSGSGMMSSSGMM
jgi:hypothetical protein